MSVRTLLSKFPMHKLAVDLSSTTLTTAAWTEILSSTPKACTAIEVFYTGEGILKLATGAAASESEINMYVVPGGNQGPSSIEIARGVRLSAKCLDQNVSTGYLVINFFG